jgi:YD repeat-containing protein
LPGLVRTWNEEGPGQTSSYTQPESGTTTYTRDPAGNITQQTDATGAVTNFAYDDNNRLISRDAPGTIDDLSIAYDAASGLVTSLTGGGAVTVYTYDAAGRIATRSDSIAGQSYASSYTYDGNDNLTLAHYPSGRDVAYEYSSDRLATIRQNGAVFASGFAYDDAGRPSGYTTGAVTHTFTFDADGRTSRILSSSAAGSLDLTYGYDRAGNVKTITDPRAGASQSFGLDVLNRLTTANGAWGSLSWTYDAAGNRLSETGAAGTTYTYDAATQRLMSTGGARTESFGYDAAGRLTSDAFGSYTYSPLGRLATTANTGVSASYGYDSAGLRLAKTVNGATTYTIRSASGDALSEYTAPCGPAVWSRDLIYAGGRLIGAVKAVAQRPTVSMTAATRSVAENAGSLAVSFTLTTASGSPLTCAVTASYRTVDASGVAPADYGARTGTLTFAAGTATGGTQTVTIPIVSDALNEANETFAVDLSSVAGGSIGATGRTTVTIADDDPVPTLTIADASVTEGNSGTSNLTFTLTLSARSGRDVQVQYATANTSATAGVDYAAASGTLTIPAGASSATLAISVFGDGMYEPNEALVVNLSAPVNATLARAQATGTILNDDAFHLTWADFVTPLDGAADAAVFSPSTAMWTFRDASTGVTRTCGPWGSWGDVPVPAD